MKMKKKVLSAAVVAAFGAMGSAQAVVVNPDGTGEVLLFPYYTVQNGQDTVIHVVNTQNNTKAVKIRFREAKNSREVLDFHLFLSPYDVWTGAIKPSGDGAMITTLDKSCTAPAIPAGGEPFRNSKFTGTDEDGAGTGIDRTKEGYVELIEMGVINATTGDTTGKTQLIGGPGSAAQMAWNIKHNSSGVPNDCAAVISAVAANNAGTPPTTFYLGEPTGGLFGNEGILNVAEGVEFSEEATALDQFSMTQIYAGTGTTAPSLAQANPPVSGVFLANDPDGTHLTDTWTPSANPVSAVLMTMRIMNEYTTNMVNGGETGWVITFPTKHFYVDVKGGNPAPFEESWWKLKSGSSTEYEPKGKSCDTTLVDYWDREEQKNTGSLDFSPAPNTDFTLCYEANVLNFNNTNPMHAALTTVNLNAFTKGWAQLTWTPAAGTGTRTHALSGSSNTFYGLPAMGFAASRIFNGSISGAYASTSTHRRYVVSGS